MLEFAIGGTLLVILSALSPIIVAWLTKASMSSKAKQTIALLISVVIAAVVAFVPALGGTAVIALGSGVGGFFASLGVAAPIVFTIQQVVFNFIFKDTEFATTILEDKGVTDTLPEGVDVDGTGLDVTDDGAVVAEDDDSIDPAELTEGN